MICTHVQKVIHISGTCHKIHLSSAYNQGTVTKVTDGLPVK